MTPLVLMTVALMLASGLIKLRAAARIGLGVHLFSLLELVMAAALAAIAFGGPAVAEAGLTFVAGAVVLLVLSSLHLGMLMGRHRKEREATQARRLESYVLYLSGAAPGGPGTASPERERDVHRPDPR